MMGQKFMTKSAWDDTIAVTIDTISTKYLEEITAKHAKTH